MDKMTQEYSDESWLEEQCLRDINAQHEESEREYNRQRDGSLTTVWGSFQDSATSLAQLYRERSGAYSESGALWLPFQTAAGTVTKLYKESCEGVKRTSEAGVHLGYQKRNKELADWARSKKRRMIRREDLLAYLAGKPLPPLSSSHNHRRSPRPEISSYPHSSHNMFNLGSQNHSPSVGIPNLLNHQPMTALASDPTNDLHTFKEALVLRPRGPELFAFVANEIARHCKRPASPVDDKMEDCHLTNKRQRLM